MTSLIHPVKIFAGSASAALTQDICDFYGSAPGDLTVSRFSDGEFQPNFNESVRGCDVFIVQSTYPNSDNLMELLMAIDAAKRASANYIIAVIPYYGFARQDRKDKPRVSIASKLVADLLQTAGANRVMTMELHAPQIQGFFNVPFDHLDASTIFVPYVKSLQLDQVAIAAPDMGAAARAKFFASHLDCPIIVCDKTRARANVVAKIQVSGEVKGKNVVIVDDLVDTAGTIAMVADQLMRKGAASVRAVCTHGVLSGEAFERIANSALTELVITDTIPLRRESIPQIKVLSVAELFAQSIRSVRDFSSISHLFEVKVKSN
ncbi:MAG: ribose-phosphate diphosphokinase [Bacteroidota bacterium]